MSYKCRSCGNEERFITSTDMRSFGYVDVVINGDGSIIEELDGDISDTEYDYNFHDYDMKCSRCNSGDIGDDDEEEDDEPKNLKELLEDE